MSSLPGYFGAAYLINLPERKDRLRSARRELARAGWRFGADAVTLFAARRFADGGGFPGGGNVRGCFESHYDCIRAAQAAGKPGVLIMEDDIALAPSINQAAASVIAQLEAAPWDFAYLGHGHTGDIAHATASTRAVAFAPMAEEIGGTHFYAVHARAFARLLAHLDGVRAGAGGLVPMPLDGAYNVFRRMNPDVRTLIAVPKLGWQRPSRSDISPHRIDRIAPLQPLVSIARNVRHALSQWRAQRS